VLCNNGYCLEGLRFSSWWAQWVPRGRGCGTIYATPLLSAVRAASRAWEILTGAGNGVCATVTGGDDRALLRQLNDDITSSGVVTPDCAILPCVRNPKVLPYVQCTRPVCEVPCSDSSHRRLVPVACCTRSQTHWCVSRHPDLELWRWPHLSRSITGCDKCRKHASARHDLCTAQQIASCAA
jgi:hypothetical protein